MTSQASFLCLEDLNIIRSEPPTNVYASPFGPAGIGASATFLRAAGTQLVSSLRCAEGSTHGPPIHTAILPPLNWFSTCVPSRSSWLLSARPSLTSCAKNSTPDAGFGEDVLAVVDRPPLGKQGDRPGPARADHWSGLPDALGVGARPADVG